MTKLLHIDASPRNIRSISRDLSQRSVAGWLSERPRDRVLHRDLAAAPPPFVTEAWVAAASTPRDRRDAAQARALAASDALIAEVKAAEVLVIGTPMYNYGMPAALKARVDQVVRVDETFSFDLSRGDWPLAPVQIGKTLVLLTSRGEFGFAPGGVRADMNFLDGHVAAVARYLGCVVSHAVHVEFQEFGDDRHARSRADAETETAALARRLAQRGAHAAA